MRLFVNPRTGTIDETMGSAIVHIPIDAASGPDDAAGLLDWATEQGYDIEYLASTTMYAEITEQGTAISETALCEEHVGVLERALGVGADGQLVDSTGNDQLQCQVCGVNSWGER